MPLFHLPPAHYARREPLYRPAQILQGGRQARLQQLQTVAGSASEIATGSTSSKPIGLGTPLALPYVRAYRVTSGSVTGCGE